ncbi:MAG: peptide chain release factor 1 [Candidatus Riflebacteria bacterium RBG_13_59_9]|nr:MAG: peptide chain release factor 1 [Candidatus Riflebacteria bacterium RBG_13_59_9]
MIREKLAESEERYRALQEELANPQIMDDREAFVARSKELAEVSEAVELYRQLTGMDHDLEKLEEDRRTLDDKELLQLVKEETERVTREREALLEKIKLKLIPPDPLDGKDIILEIRAGAGGDEAALFAADLMRMYKRFAERNRWKFEVLNLHDLGLGGVKEAVIGISGKRVYSYLKYESGVHRVQRVPTTESSGRLHTSTVTVAVLPEAKDVDVHLDDKDLRIDTFRASGAGGQHVNKTSSAIRITHLPSGLVVSCQDERSQLQNKDKALRILRAHLLQRERERQSQRIDDQRRVQVGTGERSEKIRTYNFPQDRITDHRLRENLHNLQGFLDGEMSGLVEKLRETEAASYFG